MKTRLALLFGAIITLVAQPLAAQEFPELTGRVVDAANIIPDAEEAALTAKLEALETQTERQFVVATVPTLNGDDIANYGYQLGREWGIGDAERDDGVLLLIAPNDKKVRIEVGYGLEPVLTDGFSTLIVQNKILPRFREQDFSGGINAGADAIIDQLQLPADQARVIAQEANELRDNGGGFPIGTLIWFAMIFFFFILPAMRRGGRRRRGGVVGDIILWEVGSAIARGAMSGGSGGGGWGGGGGGGFSGGGGSFGGGGASGGW